MIDMFGCESRELDIVVAKPAIRLFVFFFFLHFPVFAISVSATGKTSYLDTQVQKVIHGFQIFRMF